MSEALTSAPGRGSNVRWRTDPLTGAIVAVVESRQDRPNRPSTACPFCPGGLEAPEPYDVRWFKNRWPALPDGRCEVVLFSPEHEASLASLEDEQLYKVASLWAQRSQALGSRPDVAYVLVFENRGADVGATISHPHGQVYAFETVPPVPLRELSAKRCAICDEIGGAGEPGTSHAQRVLSAAGGWRTWAVWAPSWPFELLVAPESHLPELVPTERGLVAALKAALGSIELLFGTAMPYMLWCHQRPSDGRAWPTSHVHFHIAPAWRERGVMRYVASGELGSGLMFNPVAPEDAARWLRAALLSDRAARP